jgi:hypothetical protein
LKKKNANKSSKKYFWKTSVRVSKNAEFYADSKKKVEKFAKNLP